METTKRLTVNVGDNIIALAVGKGYIYYALQQQFPGI